MHTRAMNETHTHTHTHSGRASKNKLVRNCSPRCGTLIEQEVSCVGENNGCILIKQLKIGGVIIIPIGFKEQIMTTIIKQGEDSFNKIEHKNFRFVPLLRNKE